MMRFLRRLFRRQEKPKPAPPAVPSGSAQTGARSRMAARKYWEAKVAADRERRGTPEKRP
jgi:hypothetical protein